MKRIFSGENLGYIFVLPAVVYLLIWAGYPVLQVFLTSLYTSDMRRPEYNVFVGLAHYERLLRDDMFYFTLQNTIIWVVLSVSFHVILGLGLALLLNQIRSRSLRNLLRGILLAPYLLTTVVVATTWYLLYNRELSLIPHYLSMLGIKMEWNFLAFPETALYATIVSCIWWGAPFHMLMISTGMEVIPKELYEAASLDGAGAGKKLIHITIPELKKIFLTLLVFDLCFQFVFFELIWIMTGGGPIHSSEVLATYIYKVAFRSLDFGYASAMGMVLFLVILVTSMVMIYWLGRD